MKQFTCFEMLTWWIGASNALRTRETLKIMQGQVRGFLEAEVHFFSSFYSIAAMDGQTADHIQQVICKYTRDEILTVMWVILPPISFFIVTIYAWGILYLIIVDTPGKWNNLFILTFIYLQSSFNLLIIPSFLYWRFISYYDVFYIFPVLYPTLRLNMEVLI